MLMCACVWLFAKQTTFYGLHEPCWINNNCLQQCTARVIVKKEINVLYLLTWSRENNLRCWICMAKLRAVSATINDVQERNKKRRAGRATKNSKSKVCISAHAQGRPLALRRSSIHHCQLGELLHRTLTVTLDALEGSLGYCLSKMILYMDINLRFAGIIMVKVIRKLLRCCNERPYSFIAPMQLRRYCKPWEL